MFEAFPGKMLNTENVDEQTFHQVKFMFTSLKEVSMLYTVSVLELGLIETRDQNTLHCNLSLRLNSQMYIGFYLLG